MPLSKARDKERKRQSRLEKQTVRPAVQPNIPIREYKPGIKYGSGEILLFQGRLITIPELDADGNPVYEE